MTKDNTRAQPKWPDFIGIGAIKSGTTWLHACIEEHPQIFAPGTKELEYFNKRYSLGDEWYMAHFANPENLLAGESTPAYLHTPGCAEKIFSAAPNAKLIVCLRNPIDRAYSHFMMAQRESSLAITEKIKKFDNEIRSVDSDYIEFGYYAKQLMKFIQLYSRSKIHVVLYDDIESEPSEVVENVYEFLGVDQSFKPQSLNRRINPAARYRNARLFALLRKAIKFSEEKLFTKLILWMKTNGIRDLVLNWWRIPQDNSAMLPQSRRYLNEKYEQANIDLEKLLEIDLSIWRK